MEMRNIITAVLGVVVGLALFPVVQNSIAQVNATGITLTLLNLIPVFYVIALIVGLVAYVVIESKKV